MGLLTSANPAYLVTYDFDKAFVINSEGQGYWGNDTTNGVFGRWGHAGDERVSRPAAIHVPGFPA